MGALPSWGRSHWLPWGQPDSPVWLLFGAWSTAPSSSFLLGFPNPILSLPPHPTNTSYDHPEMLKCLPVW